MPRIATSLLEITGPDPEGRARVALNTVCGLLAALVVWACVARVDIVAVAPGRLVPQTYLKIVQPAEGGIIREILVKEGDRVEAGDVLARLDGTVAGADARSAAYRLDAKRLELRRIDAQLTGRPLARLVSDDASLILQAQADALARARSYRDQLAMEEALLSRTRSELASAEATLRKLQMSLPSYEREAAAYKELADRRLVGRLVAEEKRREAAERSQDLAAQTSFVSGLRAASDAQARKVTQVTSDYHSQLQAERAEVIATIGVLEQEVSKHGFRQALLELKAPQDGVINEVATSSLGAVLPSGATLITLVPTREPLRAEVFIDNQDIGFVSVGQAVKVKVSAYKFTQYGALEGSISYMSADASRDDVASRATRDRPSGSQPFRALVTLSGQTLESRGQHLALSPGMRVDVEIIQGERRVIEYLLSPIERILGESGRER